MMRETNKTFPELFTKTGAGSIHRWIIWTEDNLIKTEFGLVGGKQQISSKPAEAKSVGRSNETTPEEQAVLEAQSIWNTKIDKGYKTSYEEAEKEEVVLPMLAKKFKEHVKKVTWPASIQRKLNGARVLSFLDHDENIYLSSRNGKSYNLPHIVEELKDIVPDNLILDGEVYLHGLTLQNILSLIKRLQPETANLKYHVYDCFLKNNKKASFEERKAFLQDWFNQNKDKLNKVVFVETLEVSSKQEVLDKELEFISEGFEGAIVRNNGGLYKLKHRSSDLLKVKTFDDDEFKVVGWKQGIGRYQECPIFECITKDNKTFSVVPKGTMEERKNMLDIVQQYMGQWLTVRYFGYTKDGIPFHPVGIAFRPEEDLPIK